MTQRSEGAELHGLQGAEDHHRVAEQGDGVDVPKPLGELGVGEEGGAPHLVGIAEEGKPPWPRGQAGLLGQLEHQQKDEKAKDDLK